MKSVDEIRGDIYRLGEIISAPMNLLSLPDQPTIDGSPHIEILGDEYHYVSSERGVELAREKTKDIDVFMYWVFRDVTSSMASSYEVKNRIPNKDTRRLVFSKKLELLEDLNKDWKDTEKGNIKEILINNPYDDFIDDRVSLCKLLSDQGYSPEIAYEKACEKYPQPKH